MALVKLRFDDDNRTIGYIDKYENKLRLVGWIASKEKIVSVELIQNGENPVRKAITGIFRKDVQRVHGDKYLNTSRSGFAIDMWDRNLAGQIKITLKSGKVLLSDPFIVPLENPGNDDVSYLADDVPLSTTMSHDNWRKELIKLANKKKMRVLEVGSRVVTGSRPMRDALVNAEYVGFDYYEGPNVDVVGDAHKLSSYFDEKFDLICSSAVFEHLAMPWIVATEIASLLKLNGYLFVETHYSYSSHERPWHFFQYSEEALKILFSPALGFECISAGCSNPIVGRFSSLASRYLRNKRVEGLYCHSEYFGQKVREVENFKWNPDIINEVVGGTQYPKPK